MQDEQLNIEASAGGVLPTVHGSVRLWLRLIGDFEATTVDGSSALPISRKARALLALVATHTPQPVRRDVAASLLWSGKPRDHAANSLRQALRELQIALIACGRPPVLLASSGRLMLRPESVWVDVHDPAAVRWKALANGVTGATLLCRNLQDIDPAFDAHLERLWKNLVFQQAFMLQPGTPTDGYPSMLVASDENALLNSPAAQEINTNVPQIDLQQPSRIDEGMHGQGWRIAVLPFRSLGAPLEGGLSLGMAEEISSALARYRMPRLIATGSFWDGIGPSVDALEKCRAYNLDYVITGTIQASGQRIRVTVTLLDVSLDFEVIWTSRFEGTIDDLFTLQDTIASQTVAQIDPELLQRHQFRGEAIQQPNAAAHQALLTAIQGIYRPDKGRFLDAKLQLDQAIAADGNYAAAHAWLAYWHIIGLGQGWIDSPMESASRAGQAAERAIVLDPLDARGVTIAGHVKAYLLHDVEADLILQQRAISLNPNLPIAWTLSSWAHIYNGEHRIALNHATMAESLSPTDPHVFFVEHAAMTAHMFLKEIAKAEILAASVLERKPGHASALKVKIAILGHLGRRSEALDCIEQLRRLGSTVSIEHIIARPPLRDVDRAFYVEGLRLAGVPG